MKTWTAFTVAFVVLTGACASRQAVRFGQGHKLVSRALPPIEITLPPEFTYAGKFPFTIDGIAAGERHVFVDADGRRVRRTFIAQFESFLPSSDEIYRYDFSKAMDWGGFRFREMTFIFNDLETARAEPAKEAALTRAFLLERGYELPEEWMVSRFVTLGDETRKHELILFYAEDLRGRTGKTMAEMVHGEEPTPLWQQTRAELRERSLKAISIQRRSD
ncbi:MAG TPA: hypothetical protein VKB93_26680 [Thermoanaerobaculia bacterium]|nr:hypothetical protein [Thermoanaerobaculia bacterium]